MNAVEWPSELKDKVKFSNRNCWDDTSLFDRELIAQHKDKWEEYFPLWWKENLGAKIKIREIFKGHWAWCPELEKRGKISTLIQEKSNSFQFECLIFFY
jgi:hypothetical protein